MEEIASEKPTRRAAAIRAARGSSDALERKAVSGVFRMGQVCQRRARVRRRRLSKKATAQREDSCEWSRSLLGTGRELVCYETEARPLAAVQSRRTLQRCLELR